MSEKTNSPTPLSVMLGEGSLFEVKGKEYIVMPLELKDTNEFMKDNLSLGVQIFNLGNEEEREKVDRWLGGKVDKDGKIVKCGYCFDEDGNPMNLEGAENGGWNVSHLKTFFEKMCMLSG